MVLFLTLYHLILRNILPFYKMGRDLWTGFYSAFCQFLSDSDTFVMTNMIYWELVIIEVVKGFLLMSVSSDMLKNYIHEKDVKVATLAHYCQLERSTVYKLINGKREPLSAAEFQAGNGFFCSPDFIIGSRKDQWANCSFSPA